LLTESIVEYVLVGLLLVEGLFWLIMSSVELLAVDLLPGVGRIVGLFLLTGPLAEQVLVGILLVEGLF
jgi:hypothetical protein